VGNIGIVKIKKGATSTFGRRDRMVVGFTTTCAKCLSVHH